MRRAALILALVAAGAAEAQTTGQAARDAAAALEIAQILLEEAETGQDRVSALTETVRAFEDGLAAMRAGLREATIRQTEIDRRLQAQEAEIARLLGVLSAIGGRIQPQTLLHPDGPLGTARAGLLLASVTPALAGRADALRADLEEAETLRALQQSAARSLEDGLAGVQAARTALAQAIADRTDLPRRFTEDPVQMAILIDASETLDGFASGLTRIGGGATAPEVTADLEDRRPLPLPVRGTLLRAPGETDAAGVARPGMVIATRPGALVTSPAAATIRYAGPLLDYGLVAILEPQEGLMMIFAGLDAVYGEAGQVLPEGAALGLMGGSVAEPGASPSGEGGGGAATETLYIEVRQGDRPVDPTRWFATD